MSAENNAPVVFVGGPFKGLIDAATGILDATFQHRFQRVIDYFTGQGWVVRNAHQQEGWGEAMVADTVCTARDFRWMRECDLFVAFPGDPASPGTHIEIGWASGSGTPMLLVLEPDGRHAALVTGLYAVSPVVYVTYDGGPEFLTALAEAATQLASAAGAGWGARLAVAR